ncbi:hypothetical protein SKAU_G00301190 [Synaphobranchus kaupii]|uniref:Uncharacterized protein n=1 Tax=Synaphobranchus kaupii TaxID=118154 RepID=A0A9Q1INB5_SYNKA|nr:hypothetical protein SKAU_G00301190 [Synaphobranchus kaupii]
MRSGTLVFGGEELAGGDGGQERSVRAHGSYVGRTARAKTRPQTQIIPLKAAGIRAEEGLSLKRPLVIRDTGEGPGERKILAFRQPVAIVATVATVALTETDDVTTASRRRRGTVQHLNDIGAAGKTNFGIVYRSSLKRLFHCNLD